MYFFKFSFDDYDGNFYFILYFPFYPEYHKHFNLGNSLVFTIKHTHDSNILSDSFTNYKSQSVIKKWSSYVILKVSVDII